MGWVAVPNVTHHRRPPSLRGARWLFLVLGLGMLGYVGYALADAELFQAYENWRLEHSAAAQPTPPAEGAPSASLATPSTTPAAHVRITYAPGAAIGRIEIARVGIDAIIAEGIDGHTLRRAVGHIPGTALPGATGNIGIAGHRDTFFRALEGVRPDDEIVVTTMQGTYRYHVDTVKIVAPDDVAVLRDSGGNILTLVTCYPFYYVGPAPQRFIVRAHRD